MSPAGEHTTAPARALTSVPRYYFAFCARPRRHTSKKSLHDGRTIPADRGDGSKLNECMPRACVEENPKAEFLPTPAWDRNERLKHGQTWSNMVKHGYTRTPHGGRASPTDRGDGSKLNERMPRACVEENSKVESIPTLACDRNERLKRGQTWSNMVKHDQTSSNRIGPNQLARRAVGDPSTSSTPSTSRSLFTANLRWTNQNIPFDRNQAVLIWRARW